MNGNLKIVLAQINPIVGDIAGNLEKHFKATAAARDQHQADVIIFPELSLIGYPAEDLLLRPSFIKAAEAALKTFTQNLQGIYCVVGHPFATEKGLHNACSLIFNGTLLGTYAKRCLPNYGVFDEYRYFVPGHSTCVQMIKDIPCGLVICEDLWKKGPIHDAAQQGARLIFVPNASPFEVGKHEQRLSQLQHRARQANVAIFYSNCVGGQDEIIFDGGSMAVNTAGELCQLANFFEETLHPIDVKIEKKNLVIPVKTPILPGYEEKIYTALVLSIRDYINKNGFKGVLVGLSGGIDSALTLTLAVDALGKDNVKAIMMPSRYTTAISTEDAQALIDALGVSSETISIEPAYQAFLNSLNPLFANPNPSITEQNIQARCRAVILMALSNQSGQLVLTTGNRSELAVGYCTLYGDMAGGFAVLKDIPKTLVYQLAHYRNQRAFVIPERSLQRAPSAELAPDQKDEDSLPPYAILDQILAYYLNEALGAEDIIAKGFDAKTVHQVINLICKNEYKRRQAAIGPRINHYAFGKDWRYPVTNRFRG